MITREDVERIASIRDMKSTLQNWLECPKRQGDCPFKVGHFDNIRRIDTSSVDSTHNHSKIFEVILDIHIN